MGTILFIAILAFRAAASQGGIIDPMNVGFVAGNRGVQHALSGCAENLSRNPIPATNASMKATGDAPEKTAKVDHDRRQRMLDLVHHAGTCTELMTADELQAQRRRG